jgi:hypothetical protein
VTIKGFLLKPREDISLSVSVHLLTLLEGKGEMCESFLDVGVNGSPAIQPPSLMQAVSKECQ